MRRWSVVFLSSLISFTGGLHAQTSARVLVVQGDRARGNVGMWLREAAGVVVLDGSGNALPGVPVTFAVKEGEAALSPEIWETDANGLAYTKVRFGDNPGRVVLSATAAGSSAEIVLAALPAPEPPSVTQYIVSTVAGAHPVGDGLPAAQVRLQRPNGIVFDGQGNYYLVERTGRRVRKIAPDGVLTTVAGSGNQGSVPQEGPAKEVDLSLPVSLALDSYGALYIVDFGLSAVLKVDALGELTVVAGRGPSPCPMLPGAINGDGGAAKEAPLCDPQGVAVDSAGNVYIAEYNGHRIRVVSPEGVIRTLAGTGEAGFSGDGGPATEARLRSPHAVAVDGAGNILIADTSNGRIRQVSPDGVIRTLAGGGSASPYADAAPALDAQLARPYLLAPGTEGAILCYEYSTGRIRRLGTDGIIRPVYQAPAASWGFAVAPDGALLVALDSLNTVVRVETSGEASVVAGASHFSGDGGPASEAGLSAPRAIAFAPDGSFFIADTGNFRVRHVSPEGIISTIAGGGTLTPSAVYQNALDVNLYPTGLLAAPDGSLYIAASSLLLHWTPDGAVRIVAGVPPGQPGADQGPALEVSFGYILNLAWDSGGGLLIADPGKHRIQRLDSSGIISTVAGNGTPYRPVTGRTAVSEPIPYMQSMAVAPSGEILIPTAFGVYCVETDGILSRWDGMAERYYPEDARPVWYYALPPSFASVFDPTGNLYLGSTDLGRIPKISPTGVLAAIVGPSSPGFSGEGDPSLNARFGVTFTLQIGPGGDLYVCDTDNHRIRKLTPAPPPES